MAKLPKGEGQVNNDDVGQSVDIVVVEPAVVGATVDESVEADETDSLVEESVAVVVGDNVSVEPLGAVELSVIEETVDVSPGAIVAVIKS